MINFIYTIANISSFLGIILYFLGKKYFLFFATILTVIEYIIGKVTGQLKSFNTLYFAIFIGFILSLFVSTPMLDLISLCICVQNIINIVLSYVWIQNVHNQINHIDQVQNKKEEKVEETIEQNLKEYNALQDENAKLTFFFNNLADLVDITLELRIYISEVPYSSKDYFVNYAIKLCELEISLSTVEKIYNLSNVQVCVNNESFYNKKNIIRNIIDYVSKLYELYSSGKDLMEKYVLSSSSNTAIQSEITAISMKIMDITEKLSDSLIRLGKID